MSFSLFSLLPTPEIRGSNPVIGKNLPMYCIEKSFVQKFVKSDAGNKNESAVFSSNNKTISDF